MTQTTIPELVFERTLDAPIQNVFDAWTNPETLAKWFAPGPMGIRVEQVDPRVGGEYRITMIGDQAYTCIGKYTAVNAPHHLAFTFNWTGDGMPNDTLCTVDLKEEGGKTHLRFTHAGFASQESRDNHEEGWVGCLEKLPGVFA